MKITDDAVEFDLNELFPGNDADTGPIVGHGDTVGVGDTVEVTFHYPSREHIGGVEIESCRITGIDGVDVFVNDGTRMFAIGTVGGSWWRTFRKLEEAT